MKCRSLTGQRVGWEGGVKGPGERGSFQWICSAAPVNLGGLCDLAFAPSQEPGTTPIGKGSHPPVPSLCGMTVSQCGECSRELQKEGEDTNAYSTSAARFSTGAPETTVIVTCEAGFHVADMLQWHETKGRFLRVFEDGE